jgi:hypothetical protein
MAGISIPAIALSADLSTEFDIGAQLDDVSTALPSENGFYHARITPQRALHFNLRNQAGTEIGTSSAPVRIDPTGSTTQPISATALPLPTGASTSALQTTGNSSLSSINGKLNSLGQKTMSGSVPVTVSSDQSTLNTKIIGNTDGTTIGNVGDRLKVDAQFTSLTTTVPSWSSNLRYVDMNASSGGVNRDSSIPTTFTNIFNYSGSGYLAGFIINTETFDRWIFKLTIDGTVVFEIESDDLKGDAAYDVDDGYDTNQAFLGLSKGAHDRLIFHAPLSSPIRYNSSVIISLRREDSPKKFKAGLIILSKES